ncbi:MAG: hypothetical protein JNL67_19250 [Planctomycetaceae bacterium]|nr:hypothetical protein [Planctomycetaceae bacterium]
MNIRTAWALVLGWHLVAAMDLAEVSGRHSTERGGQSAALEDLWTGTYQIVPSAESSPDVKDVTIVRTEQGFQVSSPFAVAPFVEKSPGVLVCSADKSLKLYLAEATFPDGKKMRLIRAESPNSNYLMVARPNSKPEADGTTLVLNRDTPKFETAQTMVGFSDTQIFYRLLEQKVVVRVKIANEADFPFSATVYVFPTNSTTEGIEAWINNQYSDALFPETAEPSHSENVPNELCKITSAKLLKRAQEPFGVFKQYEVAFEIAECDNVAGFTMKPLRDTAQVYLKE